jgi:sugar phosphate isomerase/epimerase
MNFRSAITLSFVPQAKGGPFVLWDDLVSSVSLAAQLGFDAVEIFPPGPEFFQSRDVSQVILDHGLRVAAIGTGAGWVVHRWSLADPNPAVRTAALDFVRSIIDVAARFDAPAIIGSMQGRSGPDMPADEARAHLRSALEQLDRHASQVGGKLLYEPLNRYETDQCNRLEQGVCLIAGLERTRLLADWFHMNIEEKDIAESLRCAGSAVGHIHFADTNRQAIGCGHLDVPPLIDALRDIRYDGYLSAEVFALPDSRSAAEQTLRAFRNLTADSQTPTSP